MWQTLVTKSFLVLSEPDLKLNKHYNPEELPVLQYVWTNQGVHDSLSDSANSVSRLRPSQVRSCLRPPSYRSDSGDSVSRPVYHRVRSRLTSDLTWPDSLYILGLTECLERRVCKIKETIHSDYREKFLSYYKKYLQSLHMQMVGKASCQTGNVPLSRLPGI